jgi:hypothetical protein
VVIISQPWRPDDWPIRCFWLSFRIKIALVLSHR